MINKYKALIAKEGVPKEYIKFVSELDQATTDAWGNKAALKKDAAKALTTLRQAMKKFNSNNYNLDDLIAKYRATPEAAAAKTDKAASQPAPKAKKDESSESESESESEDDDSGSQATAATTEAAAAAAPAAAAASDDKEASSAPVALEEEKMRLAKIRETNLMIKQFFTQTKTMTFVIHKVFW